MFEVMAISTWSFFQKITQKTIFDVYWEYFTNTGVIKDACTINT